MSEWQPIETAPRDATRILGWSIDDVRAVWWWESHWLDGRDRGGWMTDDSEYYERTEPTHWHPLPDPP
jgi:hypothetical protein